MFPVQVAFPTGHAPNVTSLEANACIIECGHSPVRSDKPCDQNGRPRSLCMFSKVSFTPSIWKLKSRNLGRPNPLIKAVRRGTKRGTKISDLFFLTASTIASATFWGSCHPVMIGGLAPSNMPVAMYPGLTMVKLTPLSLSSSLMASVMPMKANLVHSMLPSWGRPLSRRGSTCSPHGQSGALPSLALWLASSIPAPSS